MDCAIMTPPPSPSSSHEGANEEIERPIYAQPSKRASEQSPSELSSQLFTSVLNAPQESNFDSFCTALQINSGRSSSRPVSECLSEYSQLGELFGSAVNLSEGSINFQFDNSSEKFISSKNPSSELQSHSVPNSHLPKAVSKSRGSELGQSATLGYSRAGGVLHSGERDSHLTAPKNKVDCCPATSVLSISPDHLVYGRKNYNNFQHSNFHPDNSGSRNIVSQSEFAESRVSTSESHNFGESIPFRQRRDKVSTTDHANLTYQLLQHLWQLSLENRTPSVESFSSLLTEHPLEKQIGFCSSSSSQWERYKSPSYCHLSPSGEPQSVGYNSVQGLANQYQSTSSTPFSNSPFINQFHPSPNTHHLVNHFAPPVSTCHLFNPAVCCCLYCSEVRKLNSNSLYSIMRRHPNEHQHCEDGCMNDVTCANNSTCYIQGEANIRASPYATHCVSSTLPANQNSRQEKEEFKSSRPKSNKKRKKSKKNKDRNNPIDKDVENGKLKSDCQVNKKNIKKGMQNESEITTKLMNCIIVNGSKRDKLIGRPVVEIASTDYQGHDVTGQEALDTFKNSLQTALCNEPKDCSDSKLSYAAAASSGITVDHSISLPFLQSLNLPSTESTFSTSDESYKISSKPCVKEPGLTVAQPNFNFRFGNMSPSEFPLGSPDAVAFSKLIEDPPQENPVTGNPMCCSASSLAEIIEEPVTEDGTHVNPTTSDVEREVEVLLSNFKSYHQKNERKIEFMSNDFAGKEVSSALSEGKKDEHLKENGSQVQPCSEQSKASRESLKPAASTESLQHSGNSSCCSSDTGYSSRCSTPPVNGSGRPGAANGVVPFSSSQNNAGGGNRSSRNLNSSANLHPNSHRINSVSNNNFNNRSHHHNYNRQHNNYNNQGNYRNNNNGHYGRGGRNRYNYNNGYKNFNNRGGHYNDMNCASNEVRNGGPVGKKDNQCFNEIQKIVSNTGAVQIRSEVCNQPPLPVYHHPPPTTKAPELSALLSVSSNEPPPLLPPSLLSNISSVSTNPKDTDAAIIMAVSGIAGDKKSALLQNLQGPPLISRQPPVPSAPLSSCSNISNSNAAITTLSCNSAPPNSNSNNNNKPLYGDHMPFPLPYEEGSFPQPFLRHPPPRFAPSIRTPPPMQQRPFHMFPRPHRPPFGGRHGPMLPPNHNYGHNVRFSSRFPNGGFMKRHHHNHVNNYGGQQQYKQRFHNVFPAAWREVLEREIAFDLGEGSKTELEVEAGIFNFKSPEKWDKQPDMMEIEQHIFNHRLEVKEAPCDLVSPDCSPRNKLLTQQLWQLFFSRQQKDETLLKKHHLRTKLYDVLKDCGDGVHRLLLVGSSLTGFGVDESDMDLCLRPCVSRGVRKPEMNHLHTAYEQLKKFPWVKCDMEIIPATVPILKLTDLETELQVDINVESTVGLRNTHLLNAYAQCDWRVRPLVVCVKVWASSQNINCARDNTISSYSLALMVLHYLQAGVSPPVVPVLQKYFPSRFNSSNDVDSIHLSQPMPEFASKNKQDLASLFLGFLDYFSKFEYDKFGLSVRYGRCIPIRACMELDDNKFSWHKLCIQEPFNFTNTARSVYDLEKFARIHDVFVKSHEKLEKSHDLRDIIPNLDLISPPSFSKNILEVTESINDDSGRTSPESGVGESSCDDHREEDEEFSPDSGSELDGSLCSSRQTTTAENMSPVKDRTIVLRQENIVLRQESSSEKMSAQTRPAAPEMCPV